MPATVSITYLGPLAIKQHILLIMCGVVYPKETGQIEHFFLTELVWNTYKMFEYSKWLNFNFSKKYFPFLDSEWQELKNAYFISLTIFQGQRMFLQSWGLYLNIFYNRNELYLLLFD